MDRSDVITLVGVTYQTDDIGQQIEKESPREVYAKIASMSASEFFAGGQTGMNPQYKATIFFPDYQGETIAEIDGNRYAIYRTYQADTDTMELYMEKKAGI